MEIFGLPPRRLFGFPREILGNLRAGLRERRGERGGRALFAGAGRAGFSFWFPLPNFWQLPIRGRRVQAGRLPMPISHASTHTGFYSKFQRKKNYIKYKNSRLYKYLKNSFYLKRCLGLLCSTLFSSAPCFLAFQLYAFSSIKKGGVVRVPKEVLHELQFFLELLHNGVCRAEFVEQCQTPSKLYSCYE